MPTPDYITPKEASVILGVSPITIRQWAQKGTLPSITTAGGHRRFRLTDVTAYSEQIGSQLAKTKDTLRVLIVDDDREFSNYLVDTLSSISPAIVTKKALDGFAAGKKLFIFRPHIVLLDLRMPDLSGVQVCQSTKKDPGTQHTRIIAMTGYSDSEEIDAVLDAGAELCLSKPINKASLIKAINPAKYAHIFTG